MNEISTYRPPNWLALAGVSILEMIAPRHCEFCGRLVGIKPRRFEFFCDDCLNRIAIPPDPDKTFNKLMKSFSADELAISGAFSLTGAKENPKIMESIYSLKYYARPKVGYELGILLGEMALSLGKTDYRAVLPVPIHHARTRERGYNQSEIIAQGVSAVIAVPADAGIVKRAVYTQTQTKLKQDTRKKNLSRAFIPSIQGKKLDGGKYLIIDDVLTTGSTINSVAECLLEMGAAYVEAASIVDA